MTTSRTPGYRLRRTALEDGPAVRLATAEGSLPAVTGAAALTDEASARGGRRARSGEWRQAARLAPGLAALAALGLAGTLGFGVAYGLKASAAVPAAGVEAGARNVVLALTNFDPGTVRADFAQIESDATGAFARQAARFFGPSIRKELAAADAASRGTIDDLYVQSVNGTHASVFVVVSQKYLNKSAGTPVNDTLRLLLGMTEVNGTWKTSSVEVLQQPVSAGTPLASPPSSSSRTSSKTGSGSGH